MTFDEHGHIIVSPKEVHDLAFSDPSALIDEMLLPGTPWAFPTYAQYTRFVKHLSDETGIHSHHFLFRGSTKIGFSISPSQEERKVWRRFGPRSDLDLAIIDPHFYATLDEEVRRHDRLPANRQKMFRSLSRTEIENYRKRVKQKGRHDCYCFFDLPRGLASMRDLQKVMDRAPVEECCVHKFQKLTAFIFRDRWAVHRRYLTDLNDLQHEN